jgi:hypothetical protein
MWSSFECTTTTLRDARSSFTRRPLSPVQFEITEQTRTWVTDWIKHASVHSECSVLLNIKATPIHATVRTDR